LRDNDNVYTKILNIIKTNITQYNSSWQSCLQTW